MKNIRFKKVNPNESLRNEIVLPNIDKGSLAVRLGAVEVQLSKLNELYKLNSQLIILSSTSKIEVLNDGLFRMSNDLRLLLIDYLRWILYHLKIFRLKRFVKFERDKPPSRTNEFHTRLNNIQKFIKKILESDPDFTLSPTNRAGRLCEHIETDNHMFNMGTILKQALRNYDVLNSGQLSIFSRYEIETLIRSKEPNFISGALINYFTEFFKDDQCPLSLDITNAIYKSATLLFYEVYNIPGFNQLRTLVFFLTSSIVRCDYKQTEKIFYAIVRIWQILGIDQFEATKLLAGPSEHESSQKNIIIETWNYVWPIFLHHSHIYPFATGSFMLSKFSLSLLSELNNSEDLLIRLSRIPSGPIGAFTGLVNEISIQMKRNVILSYVKIALSIENDQIPFIFSIFSEKEYKVNQSLVNMFLKYTKHKFNSKVDSNGPIELDKLLIIKSESRHNLVSKIFSLLLTANVYKFQIHLIYPSVLAHPAPSGLTTKKLRMLLCTSLSFISLMELVIYGYFQKKISSLRVEDPNEMLLLSKLSEYLEDNLEPNINEEIRDKCLTIMNFYHLPYFLIITYSFLNILCSSSFLILLSTHPTLLQVIKLKIQNIIRILSIFKMFKKPTERMDIDMILLSLKENVPKFYVPDNVVIDWSDIFRG